MLPTCGAYCLGLKGLALRVFLGVGLLVWGGVKGVRDGRCFHGIVDSNSRVPRYFLFEAVVQDGESLPFSELSLISSCSGAGFQK